MVAVIPLAVAVVFKSEHSPFSRVEVVSTGSMELSEYFMVHLHSFFDEQDINISPPIAMAAIKIIFFILIKF